MTFQRTGNDSIMIKAGSAAVQLRQDGHIRIQDKDLEGSGEYDVAGVGAHVFPTYAVLFAEGIRVAMVWEQPSTTYEFEEGSEVDVFILWLRDGKQVTTILKEQDPRLVILPYEETVADLETQDGLAIERQNNYKVTSQSLPAGERVTILLA